MKSGPHSQMASTDVFLLLFARLSQEGHSNMFQFEFEINYLIAHVLGYNFLTCGSAFVFIISDIFEGEADQSVYELVNLKILTCFIVHKLEMNVYSFQS